MDLLKNIPEYRGELIKHIENKFSDKSCSIDNFLFDKSIVVYAISTSKEGDIRNIILLFGKVNILQHVKRIREVGMDVRLFKIPVIKEVEN